jgi:vitamin B12 transporter
MLGSIWRPPWSQFVALAVFRRDTDDLIGFVSCFGVTTGICAGRPFGTYDNIGRARAQGLELEGQARFGDLEVAAAYTLLDAEDRTRVRRRRATTSRAARSTR